MLYRATRLLAVTAALCAASVCFSLVSGIDTANAGAPTRTVGIQSLNVSNVPILFSVDGSTPTEVFTNQDEHVEQGASVTLTAPEKFQSRPFLAWWINGFNPYSEELSITFEANSSADYIAVYGPPTYTLNVTSSPDVGIVFLNEDILGLATPYERTFDDEEIYEAIINAPIVHNDKPFAQWVLNGQPVSKLHVINIMMDKDYELEAQYGTGDITCTIQPKAARKKARWRVDGGEWMKKGTTVSGLLVGKHKIEWKPVPGFKTPNPRNVPIEDGDNHTIRGRYFPED